MTTINNTTGLNNELYWQEETVPVVDGTEQQLSQEDFFAMLTEQLANQDPTKPVDNDQMVAQMTSFTMADGISQLNDKFESFAASMTSNQALQASSLIGQNVLVQGNVGHMSSDAAGVSGVVVNEQSVQNMTITVENQYGEVIRTIDAGTQSGRKFRMRGKGMPALRRGNTGDQIVEVQIETPTNLTKKQKELLTAFSKAGETSPEAASFMERVKRIWAED